MVELKENILAQGRAIAEFEANSAAQDLVTEECNRDVGVLQAERGTLQAQNASLNIRVAEFHDEMQKIKAEHSDKFAIHDAQVSRLQSELAKTRDAASGIHANAGQQEKVKLQLQSYKEKAEKAEKAISQLQLELAQSANAASGVGDSAGQREKLEAAEKEVRRLQ